MRTTISSIAVIAGTVLLFCADVAVAQCRDATPGRCSAQQCRQRHDAQVRACGSISGSPYAYRCNANTRPKDRSDFAAKNLSCLAARRSTSECFDNIDAGHLHQITTLKAAIPTCGGVVPPNPFDPKRP
jgi:hypothetical protein